MKLRKYERTYNIDTNSIVRSHIDIEVDKGIVVSAQLSIYLNNELMSKEPLKAYIGSSENDTHEHFISRCCLTELIERGY